MNPVNMQACEEQHGSKENCHLNLYQFILATWEAEETTSLQTQS